MGSDLVGDHAGFYVIPVGEAQMFLGCHIAQHRTAKPTDHSSPDAAGDMVIPRRDIRGERAKGVKRGFVTACQLLVHVLFNLVHGDMARPFDHNLTVLCPCDFGQFAKGFQLGKLGLVIGVRD